MRPPAHPSSHTRSRQAGAAGVLTRLRRVQGQADGIVRMTEADRPALECSNNRMSLLRGALIGVAVAALTGCTAGSVDESEPADARTVQVTLNDDMTVELSQTEFAVGETVMFDVTNAGSVRHELYLGEEAAQAQHAEEMAEMGGGMGHDEPGGVSVGPGAAETLEYTFDQAGELLAGCHEPGHYEAGMVTSVTVLGE